MATTLNAIAQFRFNSRTREGCDYIGIYQQGRGYLFQFTHPGGVRPADLTYRKAEDKFQFTHPGGVRRSRASAAISFMKFQFTHPGGVRQSISS